MKNKYLKSINIVGSEVAHLASDKMMFVHIMMSSCVRTASVWSIRVVEALGEIGTGRYWRVFVGAVDAGDQSLIIRLDEESQRLTGAGVSNRGQQNSVALGNRKLH